MIMFWVVAGLLSAAAAGFVIWRTAHAGAAAGEDPAVVAHRRQLAEIDELAARGLLAAEEQEAARAEAARRLLAADARRIAAWTPAPVRKTVLAVAALAPLAAAGLYLVVGRPGMEDLPFPERLEAWKHENPARLQPGELAAVLKVLVRERPNDVEGFRFLALAQSAAGRPAEAERAARQAIELAPQRAELWELLGEIFLQESDGEVTLQAEAAFQQALKRDPKAASARFHLARARVEKGDPEGIAEWRRLLAELPADDGRRVPLAAEIEKAEKAPARPAAPVQPPSGIDIRAMVEGLAARLEQAPDDPEGWVRLVRSYAVLGETARRDAALAKARNRYAGDARVLEELKSAAATPPMPRVGGPRSESPPP